MHKNFYGYQKGNVETLYTVEFIDDPKTWKQFLSVTGNGYDGTIEPWELYKKKDFDNISEAISFYMLKYMIDSTYHIAMWEQIFYNGGNDFRKSNRTGKHIRIQNAYNHKF